MDIYISPHLDDAVLSCGGRIAAAGSEGRCSLVLTVFAGRPPGHEALSPLARRCHVKMRFSLDDPDRRRNEDKRACARLGASVHHLDYLDCLYRVAPDGSHVVKSEEDIRGPLSRDEIPLLRAVSRDLRDMIHDVGAERVFAPLALGGHRDHRIVRHALEAILPGSSPAVTVSFYEDVPYALDVDDVACLVGTGMRAATFVLEEAEMTAKLAAVDDYCSQREILWPRGCGPSQIKEYARQVGRGSYAERYWRSG